MAITTLTLEADEKGTYVISGTYYDENGDTVTPTAANWTLTDTKGNVINSRSAVTISSLSTTFAVALTGNDLAIGNTATKSANRKRIFAVQYTYNSTLGSGLNGRGQAEFTIADYVAVS